MSSSPAPVSAPLTEAVPVDGTDRLVLLDALRGFALCGVFVSNVSMWFSGFVFLPRAQMEAIMSQASLLDLVAIRTVTFLVFGKFITIFSFLFGLGFAVQMGRAEQRGASVVPLYLRRLGAMLAIGLAHLFLFWYGDILSTYAVLGVGLLLFRKRSDKSLLVWAAILIFLGPLIGIAISRLPQLLGSPAAAEAAKAAREQAEAAKAQVMAAFQSGGYFDAMRANASYYLGDFIKMLAVTMIGLLGRFLLGLYAGRRQLFQDVPQHRPLFRKVLIWGLVAGVIGNGTVAVMQVLFMRKVLLPDTLPWLPLVMSVVRATAELGLAAFYVSAFTLLFQRSFWQRLLSVLAPVGRMALSNYLCQTVISVLIFYGYGLGLMQKLPIPVVPLIPLGIFAVQIVVSRLWLAHFRFGPAEWLWRSLTYGKAQPMRRAPAEVSVATAVA